MIAPATSLTVRVPLAIRPRPGRRTVVTAQGHEAATSVPTQGDPALVKALARAHRWQRLLDEGRYASATELALAERIERGYLGKLLRLTLLAPAIVEAILDGRIEPALGLPELMRPFSTVWKEQVSLEPSREIV